MSSTPKQIYEKYVHARDDREGVRQKRIRLELNDVKESITGKLLQGDSYGRHMVPVEVPDDMLKELIAEFKFLEFISINKFALGPHQKQLVWRVGTFPQNE